MGKKKAKANAKRKTKAQIWRSLDEEWRAAFKRSVKNKWMRIVGANGDPADEPDCSLCVCANRRGRARGHSCIKVGCPLALFVRRNACEETPYVLWDVAYYMRDDQKARLKQAIAELQFLIEFLPKRDELRKKAEALIKKKRAKVAKKKEDRK